MIAFLVMAGIVFGSKPEEIGPEGITIFFISLYLFTALTIQLGILVYRRFAKVNGVLSNWKMDYSLTLALIPVSLLGLSSIDQLSGWDLIIFTALILLIIFYLSKRR
jgi:hypothetical protein